MTGERWTVPEVIAEVEWFVKSGVHPAMICTVLDRSAQSLERLLRRHGRPELARLFKVRDAERAA